MIRLPPDFKECLRLLGEHQVEYLLIGGYAVGYYGFPRATGDMDIWISSLEDNAARVSAALQQFGFSADQVPAALFTLPGNIVRMGVPPLRLEIINVISGVAFADAYASRLEIVLDGVPVRLISLEHLKANKAAAGRTKDKLDLEYLP